MKIDEALKSLPLTLMQGRSERIALWTSIVRVLEKAEQLSQCDIVTDPSQYVSNSQLELVRRLRMLRTHIKELELITQR